MKITVDRVIKPEGELVFTITVTEPHKAPFGHIEKNMMNVLNVCKEAVEEIPTEENKMKIDIISLIHAAKEKAFDRVMNNLKFAIRNSLQPKFDPICQEIYNWIYDAQDKPLKEWLQEFDPQRTTYYFDNDEKNRNAFSNKVADDKFDEEDDEDEDDED